MLKEGFSGYNWVYGKYGVKWYIVGNCGKIGYMEYGREIRD
tara:strand:- start:90 stop:212 length:123 start_codon:yes stop_codon:yes gene_type:complete